jgi:hypothetical protein
MGHLKNPALGNLNGKVGNIVGRDFGYGHYVSVRPKRYQVKKKLNEVGTKQRFHAVVKLAKNIIHFPELKNVWDNCKLPGKRGYTRIISANSKLLKDNLPTTENIITPKGRELIFDSLEVSNKRIIYTFNMAGLIKPRLYIFYIIFFYNPKKIEDGLNIILTDKQYVEIEYADRSMDKNGENYIAKSEFNDYIKDAREKFKNAILYTAVVGTSSIKNKKWWTSTVAIDISSFKLRYLFLPGNKKTGYKAVGQKNSGSSITYTKKYKRQQG